MMKYLRLAEQYASEESVRQMAMNRYTAIKELANYIRSNTNRTRNINRTVKCHGRREE